MYHANVSLMEEIVIQINGEIMINFDVSVKNVVYVKKDNVWNPATCNCENGKYLASIMYDSAIMCDEIIELYEEETNFNHCNVMKKRQPVKRKMSIYYLHFY